MKKNIAVLFGGNSPEYPVSLQSAYSVLSNIDSKDYNVIPVGITKEGKWFRYFGELSAIQDDTWLSDPSLCRKAFILPDKGIHGMGELDGNRIIYTHLDGVFPVLHGQNGEDGTIQGLCQLAGIPVVGCGCLASALCMDKHRAHQVAAQCGIKVTKSVHFDHMPSEEELQRATKDMKYPLFVKPLRGGSSVGMTKLAEASGLIDAVSFAFSFDNQIVIEENVEGFEVGCAVLGEDELVIGRVDEVELCQFFFDFEEKYSQKNTTIHMPARIDPVMEDVIKETALKIYKALDCSGFARVDMFLTPDGEIFFNEVNTIPGFTTKSRFPSMLAGIDMDYAAVVKYLLETVA